MFIVLLTFTVFVRSQLVSVEISNGSVIIGQKNKGYNTFFGVPYAQVDPSSPFGIPLTQPAFTTPFHANDSTIMCPQIHEQVGGILQCLRLNIYVPQTVNNKRAVLVWFPSSFKQGRAGDYGGQHLAKEDIIVAIANYRLGVYGFSCLNESFIPSNTGLRDQDAALKWIKNYIEKFGGDPTAVTIGGQGYAGGFVDLHMYSDLATRFDKAIIQSGSIFAKGFFDEPDPSAVVKIAKYLGMTIHQNTKPKDVLPHLSQLDPIDIVIATKILNIKSTICKETFTRHGVKSFISKGPYHLRKLDKIKNTKILIGYNSMEFLPAFAQNNTKQFYNLLGDVFYDRLTQIFHLPDKEQRELSKKMKHFYMGGQEIGPETRIQLVESAADLFVYHAIEMSVNRFLEAGTTVYKYLFSYSGGSQYKNIVFSGAPNKEELKYLFEMESKIKGSEQQKIRNILVKYWANFVKFGNPTSKDTPIWRPMTSNIREYLDINVKPTMKDHVFRERMAFLDLLFHSYQKYLKTK